MALCKALDLLALPYTSHQKLASPNHARHLIACHLHYEYAPQVHHSANCSRIRQKALYSRLVKRKASNQQQAEGTVEEDERETSRVLEEVESDYNYIQVIEVPEYVNHPLRGARVLLLDLSGNIHSLFWPRFRWTDSYYDDFAGLPAIIPKGPIGFLGLGGGTAPRIFQEMWPGVEMEGWELDPAVITVARKHLGIDQLENPSESWRGRLKVHVGDALSDDVSVEGGFAGLVVDLFAYGAVLRALWEVDTWQRLKAKLKPGGRIIVNCGGECVEQRRGGNLDDGTWTWTGGGDPAKLTVEAMKEVFPGEVFIRKTGSDNEINILALTGPEPDWEEWANALPMKLKDTSRFWNLA